MGEDCPQVLRGARHRPHPLQNVFEAVEERQVLHPAELQERAVLEGGRHHQKGRRSQPVEVRRKVSQPFCLWEHGDSIPSNQIPTIDIQDK